MKPPAIGPSIGPIRPGIATKLMARISSDLAKVRTSVSRPTGTIMAPPQPCRMRQATSTWMLVEMPQRNEPSVKSADGGGEHAARAEAVGHPAADGNEDGEAERVAGEHRLHAERRDVERGAMAGDGGVENGGVERLHEERHRDEPR